MLYGLDSVEVSAGMGVMWRTNKNGDSKAAASSAIPLSIHLKEAVLIRTQFFCVFFGTPDIARIATDCFTVVLARDTVLHYLGVLLRIIYSGRIRRILIRP